MLIGFWESRSEAKLDYIMHAVKLDTLQKAHEILLLDSIVSLKYLQFNGGQRESSFLLAEAAVQCES